MSKSNAVQVEDKKAALNTAVENAKDAQVELPEQPLPEQPLRTVSGMIGDIVWLMSQSQGHKYLTLVDLEWMLMPPVVLEQYKIYRDEQRRPVGVALWAYLNEDAEVKLQRAGKIAPMDWGNGGDFSAEKGLERKDGGNLWLIELISPFNNEANKQKEQMLVDLMNTNFKDTPFKMMRINPETGKKESGWVNEK